jgi:putative transposase
MFTPIKSLNVRSNDYAAHLRCLEVRPIAKRNLSKANQAHKVDPYLLRNLIIDRPNQFWSTDITYITMAIGFVYLGAVIDWYSRRVLSWRLSNTMDTAFCIDALEEAIERNGAPDIFNTDQGSQFTSEDFTGVLKSSDIAINMNGKRRWVEIDKRFSEITGAAEGETYKKYVDGIALGRAQCQKTSPTLFHSYRAQILIT